MGRRLLIISGLVVGLGLSLIIPATGLINPYYQQILMYVGINILLTASLNLVNGYMGEFSVGHAGFMAVGAYSSSLLTLSSFFTTGLLSYFFFPAALILGGLAAAITGFLIAIPSFKTRGDYLAIVTLAFNMIIKSVIENIEAVGGPRGMMGMPRLTTMAWVFVWVVLGLYMMRNFIYSRYGRGAMAIREDETAAEVMSVNTRQCKVLTFSIAAFFAGVAGGLFAHLITYIHPSSFSILKSVDILVMVYLGGMGSLAGSIVGAALFTTLLELLRFLGLWRWVAGPLLLVILMILRPWGIMGKREFGFFIPKEEKRLLHGTASS